MNEQQLNPQAMDPETLNSEILNPETLNLRDIHLPEAISWWPLAPGWWMLLVIFLLAIVAFLISRKIYRGKQLKRDIIAELESIKAQFNQTQNKSELAKTLSVLLRRASISYFPAAKGAKNNIAGLTGEHWLAWLDKTSTGGDSKNTATGSSAKGQQFLSDTGQVLIHAPYLPENAELDFDENLLIHLCESWLLANHNKQQVGAA